ncbi:hypothetical protein L2E82_28122 [Cichorium intybus]|uniref:Uncharacterized protein n=1 Tax=Cichorium intybus TaxID=13427 RepID=A0ACB9CV88_CICIN|nr:hypothetical protein L2E82_28122 [Cichorium intybus]
MVIPDGGGVVNGVILVMKGGGSLDHFRETKDNDDELEKNSDCDLEWSGMATMVVHSRKVVTVVSNGYRLLRFVDIGEGG